MLNTVIGGDYCGNTIIGKDILCIKTRDGNVVLCKDTVKNYTLISQGTKSTAGNAVIGGLLGGITGAIIGSSSGSGTTYTVAVEYKVKNAKYRYERKKSLIELDDKFYKIFLGSMF